MHFEYTADSPDSGQNGRDRRAVLILYIYHGMGDLLLVEDFNKTD